MMNKAGLIILALLALVAGAGGYYAYTLTRQVGSLEDVLASYQDDQAARIESLGKNLGETLNQSLDESRSEMDVSIGNLSATLNETRETVGGLAAGMDAVGNRINAVEGNMANIDGLVGQLEERVSVAESSLAGTMIQASDIYSSVVQATVRITNGTAVIGSGFIYDESGRVITAYHVINGLSPIFVMMYDGRVSRATVSGFSESSDVAVLRLDDNPGIAPAPLADSGQANIGDQVVALGTPGDPGEAGNPLGMRDTLTSGIISQKDRFVNIDGNAVANLLQFDAPVNYGNSGCALFDAGGNIIGLVIARIPPSSGDGIYWAVSSNKVKKVAESIIKTGSFPYPWIGVGIADLSPLMVEQLALETANGVLVTSVFANSPAVAAGFRDGDIIIAMDGIPVRNADELVSFLAELYSPGEIDVIDVLRDSSIVSLTVVVGERP